MNIPVDYDDDKEWDRTHPGLLPEEDDGVQYVPPTPGRVEESWSNPRCTSNTGKDRRSVLSDKVIAKVNRRGSALRGTSKSGSEVGPKQGIIKRGRELKYSPRGKTGPRPGHP